MQNCRIANTWGDGINLNNVKDGVGINLSAKNNVIRGTGDDCIALNSVHNNGAAVYAIEQSCSVINNTVSCPNWANCLRVAGGTNVLVQDNLIGGSTKSTGLLVGIFGTNGDDLVSGVIQGNVINKGTNNFNAPRRGSLYVGTPVGRPSTNVHVRNNTINNSFYDGISMGAVSNTWLQNNTVNSPKLDGISASSDAAGAVVLDSNPVTGLGAGRVALRNDSVNLETSTPIIGTSYSGVSGGITAGGAGGGDLGTDLQNISNGNYVWYNNVNLTDMNTFVVRAATASAGGNIEIRLGSATGTLIGTCVVTSTGDYHGWKDFYCDIAKTTGTANVYLKFTGGTGGLMNLESFAFTNDIGEVLIQTGQYDVMSGLTVSTSSEGIGLDSTNAGDYVGYNSVPMTGATTFTVRAATGSAGGTIQIRTGSQTGPIIGNCTVTNTGGFSTWQDFSCALTATTGSQNIYLTFTGSGSLMKTAWFVIR